MRHGSCNRIRLISVALICVSFVIIGRLYFLQVVHADEFSKQANDQYVKPAGDIFDRGSIFFKSKDGELISGATLQTGAIVAINPKTLKDGADTCEKVKLILNELDCQVFITKASKKDDPYEEIAKQVSTENAKKISDLNIAGLSIYQDRWRFYPGKSLAAHLLGFVGFKGNELGGRYGLEKFYDEVLNRTNNNPYVNFFAEIFTDINKTLVDHETLEGDIVTTIEPTTQAYLEEKLQAIKSEWNSDAVGGIIINPKTGAIYAMALTPSFDPNNFRQEDDVGIFSNGVVEDSYEMGSVIKSLTMATAIDLGIASGGTIYNDTGSVTIGNYTIYNFDKKGRGMITLQEAMGKSLNTGFVFLGNKIGQQNFRDYFLNFGLGEKTGIDLPGEGTGLVSNLTRKTPIDIEYANMSFGQGIAITPIAAVRALSALANGGTLITPHVVERINYKIGLGKDVNFSEGRRVLKPETSVAISKILVEDFDKYFQNGKSKNPNYSIAEKTGTAQIALPNGKGYYDDRFLHTFFGYFPAYDSKFLVFLYNVNPKGAQYSSESLGPAFVDLTKFLINYYEVAPDR